MSHNLLLILLLLFRFVHLALITIHQEATKKNEYDQMTRNVQVGHYPSNCQSKKSPALF